MVRLTEKKERQRKKRKKDGHRWRHIRKKESWIMDNEFLTK